MIERTVEELTPIIGTRPACRAVGASGDDLPSPTTARAQATKATAAPDRALSAQEREPVLAVLHSERFVDVSPEGLRDLARRGQLPALERTMYRHPGRAPRRRARAARPAHPSRLRAARAARRATRMSCGRGTSPSSRARRSGPGSTCT